MISVALLGNPNCGKTTLFNALTGSNQYVGNWAGVTVEKKVGKTKDGKFLIVDLPGIYSMSPYSMEEIISRDYIINEKPKAIINIVDGTNIERNLYLTVQLIELGIPMVLVINMMDDVKAQGTFIDAHRLSELIGMPVVPISARHGDNIQEIMRQVSFVTENNVIPPNIGFEDKTQNALNEIFYEICDKIPSQSHSFYSSKILEGDEKVISELKLPLQTRQKIEWIAQKYESTSKYGDRETMLADARYRFIENSVKECIVKGKGVDGLTVSDKIDLVVTNRFFAIPIFLLIMLGMFMLTFGTVGSFLSNAIESFFSNVLTPAISTLIHNAAAPKWTESLIIEGIINGVGGILTFLPQISILFLCLSILEDSGYMARAAFITDRFLRKLGLSGKSFIPMIMGFGCTTPAVMATKTQENTRERRMTILLIPFMSCGARLPIYALFAGVFFTAHQGIVVFSMYIIGFFLAILAGLILKKTIFKTNMAPFVMELPPYRTPMISSVLKNTWDKCKSFIIKAGTIIFAMSIIIWLLQSFTPTFSYTQESSDSIFAYFGRIIAPVLIPLGFGTWKAAVSLLSGLVAKEAVVSTMLVLYSASNEAALSTAVLEAFSPLSAYSFMVFCLLYTPCISAFVTIKKEMGSLKWALASSIMQCIIAYLAALFVYQIGVLF